MPLTQVIFSLALGFLLSACGGSSNTGTSTSSIKINSSSSVSSLALNSTPASMSPSKPSSSASLSSAVSNSSFLNSSIANSSFSISSSDKPILLAYGNNQMQVGELRLPENTTDKLVPLVIVIHGGCWVSSYASYHFMDDFARSITSLGYATWNIEYRALGTGGDWPIIFQDVNKAVDYSRTLAQHYSIDINKVAVIGHSAGGHLALWAASRNNINTTSEIYTENPLSIRGVISLAGIANVTGNNSCGGLANNIIGVPISPMSNSLSQRLLETSPLHMLPIKIKTVLISGSADGIVPASMGTEYSTEANKQGDNSVHYVLPGLGHFDLIDATKTNWALYQESLIEMFKD